jgi:3-oxoacyl-[acyl-carrier protein] reductase
MIGARTGASIQDVYAGWEKQIPAGRLASTEEFAAVVAFLASARASYVNGVSLAVDGGTARGLL